MEVKTGYKRTEVGVIPTDWDVCPVREKGEVITGKALAAYAPGAQRPYLRTKNVFDGRIDITDVLTMPMTDEQFAKFQVRYGDVLLNEGQSIELVGRCALYGNEYPRPCAIQNQLLRFRAHEGTSEVFASYVFRNCQRTGVFARIALQTTSIAHLGGARFERLRLAWPSSHDEQQAIAQALTDVDDLIQSLEQLIAKKRDLKQAAMQQLLTGQTRLPGFSGEWTECDLGDIGVFNKGQGIRKDQVRESGLPCIRYGEIYTRHNDFIRRFYSFIDVNTAAEASRLRSGDLLFAGSGETAEEIGKCVAFVGSEEAYAGGDIVILSAQGHDSRFLGYLMNHPCVAKQKARLGQGDAVCHIGARSLSAVIVRLPGLSEQRAIAEVLSDMDAEITALEARLTKTRDVKQGMMQELLTGRTRLV